MYSTTQLRSLTCHKGSHSVTCYPTQVNTPRLNPSHSGRYSIYLPRRDGRLSWPSWLDSAPAGNRTSDLSITSPTLNHCTTKTTLILPDTNKWLIGWLSFYKCSYWNRVGGITTYVIQLPRPALGMFELFGRTGPPILGGPPFWTLKKFTYKN